MAKSSKKQTMTSNQDIQDFEISIPEPLFPFSLEKIAERWLDMEKFKEDATGTFWNQAKIYFNAKYDQLPPAMSALKDPNYRRKVIEDKHFWGYITGRKIVTVDDWHTLKTTIASLCLESEQQNF